MLNETRCFFLIASFFSFIAFLLSYLLPLPFILPSLFIFLLLTSPALPCLSLLVSPSIYFVRILFFYVLLDSFPSHLFFVWICLFFSFSSTFLFYLFLYLIFPSHFFSSHICTSSSVLHFFFHFLILFFCPSLFLSPLNFFLLSFSLHLHLSPPLFILLPRFSLPPFLLIASFHFSLLLFPSLPLLILFPFLQLYLTTPCSPTPNSLCHPNEAYFTQCSQWGPVVHVFCVCQLCVRGRDRCGALITCRTWARSWTWVPTCNIMV